MRSDPTIVERLRRHADTQPDALAFAFVRDRDGPRAELSYAELDLRSDRTAAWLADRGLRGRIVALMLPSSLDFIVTLLGCFKAGAIAVPLPSLRTSVERMRFASVAGSIELAAVVVADVGERARLRDLACDDPLVVTPAAMQDGPAAVATALAGSAATQDLAYLQFTSGSTARPRGVRILHRNIVDNSEATRLAFGTDAGSRGVGWLPMFHDMGLIGNVLHPLWVGFGAVLMTPATFLRRPRFWLETIARERATISGAPPSALRYCVDREDARGEALDLSGWKVAFIGAERIDPAALDGFVDAYRDSGFARESLFPCYGLAEATLFVTGGPPHLAPRLATASSTNDAPGTRSEVVGCGRIDRMRVAIVDAGGTAIEHDGEVGGIWVAGGSVADGYQNGEGESGFGRRLAGSDEAWLDTGDLGFVRRGELFVTGRRKELIVVGGANHYPQDIERAAADAAPEIDPAGCAAFAVANGATEGAMLVAELRRSARLVEPAGVRARIIDAVAHATGLALVAVNLVRPGSLPRTTSGKIERLALRRHYADRPRATAGDVAVPTSLRDAVALISGRPAAAINLSASARAAGLDSLGIYRLTALAADHLGLDGDVQALFADAPLTQAFGPATAPSGVTEPAAVRPFSDGELGLWLGQQAHPDSAVYTLVGAAAVSPPPDPDRLRAAFAAVVARHRMLTARVDAVDGMPVWHWPTSPQWSDCFVVEECADAAERDARLRVLAGTTIDLHRDPLVRLYLLLTGGRATMAIVAHHLVVDAAALQQIVLELDGAYRDPTTLPAADLPDSAPPPPVRRSDPQRNGAHQPMRWPHRDPAAPALAAARLHAAIDPAVTASASRTGSSAALAFAAMAVAVARWTGERRPTIVTPLLGRIGRNARAIGFHARTVAVTFDLDRHANGADLIGWTADALRQAAANQLAPFAGRTPTAAGCLFTFHRPDPTLAPLVAGTGAATIGDWRIAALDVAPAERLEDVALAVSDTGSGWRATLDVRRDRIGVGAAARLLDYWRTLVYAMAAAPEAPFDLVDTLGPEDRSRISGMPLASAADTDWLDRIVAGVDGDRPAIHWGEVAVTYEQLRRMIAGARRALGAAALPPASRVAVCLPRTPRLVAAMLAVLAEGHAYVPLDPSYPPARLREILVGAAPAALIAADRAGVEALEPAPSVAILCDEAEDGGLPLRPPARQAGETLAAILFTSGSTGRPKGVMLRHGAIASLLAWAHATFPPTAWRDSAAVTSVCFDLSIFELFAPLAAGGTLRLFEDATALAVDRRGASALRLLNTVPSAARALIEYGALPPNLEAMSLAGEPLPGGLVDEIGRTLPGVRIWNLYGPTEDTTYSTAAPLERDGNEPGIGLPLPGTEALLLDLRGRDVPRGAVGEIYLAGAGLARGYLDAPALTAERFVPHPSEPGARAYRTGDLARLRPGGDLELLGRCDNQVKLRGFRIELDEVAAALSRLNGVGAACVLHLAATESEPAALVGFVEASAAADSDYRAALGQVLPQYMVPAAIVRLDRLPLTANGKIDRHRLAELPWRQSVAASAAMSETEQAVADCWTVALGHRDFGSDDEFAAAGGDSLLAMTVLRGINERFDLSIDLASVARYTTVRALAAHVDRVCLVRGVDGTELAAAAELIEL